MPIKSELFFASNEMLPLFESTDWSKTSLGPASGWSTALKLHLSTVFNSIQPMVIFWGHDLVQIYNNAFIPSMGNLHPGAFGALASEVWRETWEYHGALVKQVMETGCSTQFQNTLVPMNRNGRIEDVYWNYSFSPLRDDGKIGGVLIVCTETTPEVKAIKALSESEKWLNDLFMQAPFPMCILSGPDYVYKLANATYEEFLQTKVVGKKIADIVDSKNHQQWKTLLDKVRESSSTLTGKNEIFVRPNHDGTTTTRALDYIFQPISGEDVADIMIVFQDVTEEAMKQERANQTFQETKLAALGLMSAEIGHEINNPLSILKSSCLIIERIVESKNIDSVFLSAKVRDMNSTIQRLYEIVQSMRNLARDTSHEKSSFFTAREITNDIRTLSNLKLRSRNIDFRLEASDEVLELKVNCRLSRVSQVLINLITNAIQSLEDQSLRWIELKILKGEDCLIFQVSDSGPGVPVEIGDKIFQPLFTTKSSQGTGLGLSISRDLVQKEGGTLNFMPAISPSCFQMKLPITE